MNRNLEANQQIFSEDSVVTYYETVAKDGLYEYERNFLIQCEINSFSKLNILVLGCGAGREAIAFSQAGAYVTAIDFSVPMLIKARHLAQRYRVVIDFHQSNVFDFVTDKKFDLIFGSHNFISHTTNSVDRINLLEHIKGLLTSRGTVILTFNNRLFENSIHYENWLLKENSSHKNSNGFKMVEAIPGSNYKLHFHFFSIEEFSMECEKAGLIVDKIISICALGNPPFKWSETTCFSSLRL